MKKILSIILACCMLLTSCIVLSSCGSGLSTKDVDKNASNVISTAVKNMSNEFFPDDVGLGDVVESASKAGSLELSFESDLLGIKFDETLYLNSTDKKLVSDTSLSYGGMDLAMMLFGDKNGIALKSESITGDANTYKVDVSSLASKLETSVLFQAFTSEIPAEEKTAIVDAVKAFAESYAASFETAATNMEEDFNAYLATLDQKASKVDVEIDGTKVSCIEIAYTFNNATIKALAEKIIDEYVTDADEKTEAKEAVTEGLANVTIDVTAKVDIDAKTSKLVGIFATGSLKIGTGDEAVNHTIDMSLTFSASKIAFKVTMNDGETTNVFEAVIAKTVADGATTYVLTLSEKDGDADKKDLFTASYKYTKATGAFVVTIKAAATNEDIDITEGIGDKEITIEGTVKVTADNAKIEVTSFKMGDITVAFKLGVTFNKTATMPTVAADAKDIIDLDETEFVTLMNNIMNSDLVQLISAMGGGGVPEQ